MVFSHRFPPRWTVRSSLQWWRAAVSALTGVLVVLGCGSVGPAPRAQTESKPGFVGVECEEGLVLECEPACSRGDARACEIAGLGYLEGKVVSQDLGRARIMLERSCEKGRALACSGWAKMAGDGQGVNLPTERQQTLLELGCKQGDGNACYRLGVTLLGAEPSSAPRANLVRAHAYFESACEAKEVQGCMQLGLEAKDGRLGSKDLVAAASLLDGSCKENLAIGCYELGDLQTIPNTAVHNPARARQNFDKACSLNAGVACSRLAVLMEAGEKNVARARELHEKACGLEQAESCVALGLSQRESDPAAAELSFARACAAGIVHACFEQATLLDGSNPSVEAAPDRALPLLHKACEANIAPACSRAARLELDKLGSDVVPRDARQRIVNLVRKGCEQERQDESCLTLATWLATGESGLPKDAPRAAALLGPLCARSTNETPSAGSLPRVAYGGACHQLGLLHEQGSGVAQNVLGAVTLYEKGCSAGYTSACLAQAVLLWRGTGNSKKDPESAVAQFQKLCRDDSDANKSVKRSACVHWGYAQMTGIGTPRDLRQARTHFERHCDEGDQSACAHLGHYLLTTRGSEADRKQGESLLRAACDSANGQGCLFLADLPSLAKNKREELLTRACQLGVAEACVFRKLASP